ncbi:MAG: GIY-YIG nuclease family protein [Patescibacteria group bacterium]|nr:GIY-YIG nuclease family protein [Patescibacteria group bacterium]
MYQEKLSYVYIMASGKNGILYIGVTADLQNRVYGHKQKLVEGFTKKYNVDNLVYYEIFGDIGEAIMREKQLKKWKREWKIKLIEKNNPGWKDLCDELFKE